MHSLLNLRVTLAIALFSFPPTLVFAGPGIGIIAGMSRTIDNLSAQIEKGYTTDMAGTPIMAELFWSFGSKNRFELGARTGLSRHIETISPPAGATEFIDISVSTRPLSGFARIALPFAFIEASGGVHFADISFQRSPDVPSENEADDLSGKQTGITAGLSLGPAFTLFKHAILRGGFSADIFHIPDIGTGSPVNLLTLSVTASLSLRL